VSSVTIRDASDDDLAALVEIYNHYVVNTPITFDLEPYSIDERRPWFEQFGASSRHTLLVAEDAGAVIGYAGTHQFRTKKAYDTTVETTIYCAPDATGRSIGVRLYEALFAALDGEDIHSWIAGITLPNDASVRLHERFGFVPAGRMHAVGYKFGQYWDVGWYERVSA
jgi:phosphinothricin acetyltransferase